MDRGKRPRLSSFPEEEVPSHSGVNVDEPAIFLSHSGRQKRFVEHLYDALEKINHTAFFDKHSLPKGSPFQDNIRRAALGCKLGVVVLSEDFLTSKWPMLELEMLVLRKGNNSKVFPICYELDFDSLKSSTNLQRWRKEWQKMDCEQVEEWQKAVEKVASFNGEIYNERKISETTFIKKVMAHILQLVPCRVPYNMSSIQGHERLAEEVTRIFNTVKVTQPCMVGLHGVGGLGKTTLCMNMVNLYTSPYHGRSCLIEFPSDGDEQKIVEECRKALGKLTNLSHTYLSKEVSHFEQGVHLMEEKVRGVDVFLAIDNVWQNTQEKVKELLHVRFGDNSRILVTSRSEEVLQDLLGNHGSRGYVGPLPTPNHEEAFQIFQNSSDRGDLKLLLDSSEIQRVLETCRFSGDYHPIALKQLGRCARKAGKMDGHLLHILEEMSDEGRKSVESLIRLNFENLTDQKKSMFLDIALWLIHYESWNELTFAKAQQWLGFLHSYKEPLNENKIGFLIYDLASEGLIQVVEGNDGYGKDKERRIIEVHDLFLDLARQEVAKSPRILTEKSTSRLVEQMEWQRFERVFLVDGQEGAFEILLMQQELPELRVLEAAGMTVRSGICLHCMPSLCVLKLSRVTFTSEEFFRSAAQGVMSVANEENRSVGAPRGPVLNPDDLHFVPSLCVLILEWVFLAIEGEYRSAVLSLNDAVKLQIMHLERCYFFKSITGLDALKNLQDLRLHECSELENLDGLSGSIQLRSLDITRCHSLERIPDLDLLTCLESFMLIDNMSMKEVGGDYLSSTLKFVTVVESCSLERFPRLNQCVQLQDLCADGELVVTDDFLSSVELPNLRHLTIRWNSSCSINLLNEQWRHATLLRELHLKECCSLTSLVQVGCLRSLEMLWVEKCVALEEISDVGELRFLQNVTVRHCRRLRKVEGLEACIRSGIDIDKGTSYFQVLELIDCVYFAQSSIPDACVLEFVPSVNVGVHTTEAAEQTWISL